MKKSPNGSSGLPFKATWRIFALFIFCPASAPTGKGPLASHGESVPPRFRGSRFALARKTMLRGASCGKPARRAGSLVGPWGRGFRKPAGLGGCGAFGVAASGHGRGNGVPPEKARRSRRSRMARRAVQKGRREYAGKNVKKRINKQRLLETPLPEAEGASAGSREE